MQEINNLRGTVKMESQHISFTWIGFGGFYIKTSKGKDILIDSWVKNNPVCPEVIRNIEKVDYIFFTHAHRDHAEDAVWLAQKTGAVVLAGWELAFILQKRGVQNTVAINKGRTRRFGDITVTSVHADHTAAFVDGDQLLYGGEPMGYIIKFENGKTIYHAGDTNVFGDMALIAELYEPEIALLPIGDVYTMPPREAAKAVRLLNVKNVIPTHFGGFDFLTGRLRDLLSLLSHVHDLTVHDIKPGDSILVR
ncbi:metal-dependent hydrolase [Paenibacillus chondroitinus]|uniref:Metal-dependent hydrolase n=1 Tax=Paenibacillus chondroitinus TaxID=59842 RepID=A0ABU6DKE1_9BACL|nr:MULTISPECIES: metal-dependent hydrolase [Paenibacillus]MCY9663364.1 metal-dependent hydrolase [Paenibacillus anseongense]MEB4798236.1 metal-dependent hydrolase [Paenibacillus chondroitinus]